MKLLETGIRESPSGGSRIAWSYLVVVVSAAVAGLAAAAAFPVIEAGCRDDSAYCDLGWGLVVFFGVLLLTVGVGARVAALGWEWFLVFLGVTAVAPVLLDAAVALGVLGLLVGPAAAGFATNPPLPAWGRLAVAIGAATAVLLTAVWLLV